MSRAALFLLLIVPQDGAYLPLREKDLASSGKEERLVFAYYYNRDDSVHRRELQEMGRMGVDVALVLGENPERLASLVQALEALRKEGRDRPRLAPAIDLSPLKGADLTVDEGKRRLYAIVHGFYSRVPPQAWTLVDGRPLLWLLPAPAGTKYDRGLGEALNEMAKADFDGRTLFLAADVTWRDLAADRAFAWGAAHDGPRELPVVSVGPGSISPERSRDDGKFYERAWYVALKLAPRWIAIETWNGVAEGTDVAESREYKTKYAEATQSGLRKFRLGETSARPKGKWTGASKALYTAKYLPHEQGLRPVESDEGTSEFIQLRGVAMLASKEKKAGARRYLSFDVDDSFAFFEKRSYEVTVEFLDTGEGAFTLEYDAWDRSLEPAARAVKSAGEKRFTATADWRTETFDLPDARFGNSQPGGSDFRLASDKRGVAVRRVAVAPK
jgi:hypothetical protein